MSIRRFASWFDPSSGGRHVTDPDYPLENYRGASDVGPLNIPAPSSSPAGRRIYYRAMKHVLFGLDANGKTTCRFLKKGVPIVWPTKFASHVTSTIVKKFPDNCPLCGVKMISGDPRRMYPQTRSRDHILPKRDGHGSHVYGDTRNIRIVCQSCNGLLDRLGQCPGAVACWIAVTRREWRMT
jgi:hypothetical protein